MRRARAAAVAAATAGLLAAVAAIAFAGTASARPASAPFAPLAAPITVNMIGDAADASTANPACDSDDTAPGDQCTLRAAIMQANVNPGTDTIAFAIGAGPQTITPASSLPAVTQPAIIDGTTQPGFAGTPIIELNGTAAGASSGLVITAGNSTVRGLVINRFGPAVPGIEAGIQLTNGGNNVVEGNLIGTDITGTIDRGNTGNGIYVSSSNNVIGGTTAAQRNIISGNGKPGIIITALLAAANTNTVQGNYIGTDITGTAALGNDNVGVLIRDGVGNTVGGTAGVSPDACWGACNIISATKRIYTTDGYGIVIHRDVGTATGNIIQGNYIGTDITGTAAFGNVADGVRIDGAAGNTIGGDTPEKRNIIANSGGDGIDLRVAVGTMSAGNTVQGNYIGTDITGTLARANGENGIYINNTPGNTIGGSSAARNIISGNGGAGVKIAGANATGNTLQSNYIGLRPNGATALKNLSHGVFITTSASNNTIGGTAAGQANAIAFNGGDGVYADSGTGNTMRRNEIFSNDGLGIDLGANGEDLNDALDADAGANNLQNTPTLTSAPPGIPATVAGFINAAANTTYTLEFFSTAHGDASPLGEGRFFIGSTAVTTDGAGHHAFSVALTGPVLAGDFVTATATDPAGNTSEYSHDADLDALFDGWETTGIDFDRDGTIDLTLPGANPLHKDLYVEVDAMSGRTFAQATLDRVAAAFAAAPNALVNNPNLADGVALHIEYDERNLPLTDFVSAWTQFNAVKENTLPMFAGGFGTVAQRGNLNANKILGAKKQAYRYAIIGNTHDGGPSSGKAEIGGNDFMVTLGGWTVPGGTADQQAGTFMHEFGHTLGLRHGGDQADLGLDGIPDSGDENGLRYNFKPNYHSLMNYTWQTPKPAMQGWTLDYSRAAFPDLNETNLNETAGIGGHAGHALEVGPAWGHRSVNESGPVDWSNVTNTFGGHDKDGDGIKDNDTGVAADINHIRPGDAASPGDLLSGFEDWSHLNYHFHESPDFADGVNTIDQRDEEPVTDFISNEMKVSGNAVVIEDGDAAADPADHTDFGGAQQSGGTVTRTFTVQNLGNYALNLTGAPRVQVSGPAAAEFTVTLQPASLLVAYSGTTTFQVRFAPTTLGLREATISIPSDDGDANPYDFGVAGTGLVPVDSDGDGVSDATDNCPSIANPAQTNTDGNFIDLHVFGKLFDDITAVFSDNEGDACDAEIDNDGISNTIEAEVGPAGAYHPWCTGATGPTNPLLSDTDDDLVLDGAECAMGTDPLDAASKPPAAPPGDTDHDGLTDAFEATIGTNPALVDTDGDRLLDSVDYKGYQSNPLDIDTDGDACPDGREAASVNADVKVNSLDMVAVASHFGPRTSGKYIKDFDVNKDGNINSIDMLIQAKLFTSLPC